MVTINMRNERKKEIKARNRARRIRSMIRRGMTQEQIDEWFKNEDTRMVLCILYGTFKIEDGTRKKKVYHRGVDHHVTSVEEEEVPIVLKGLSAAKKFAENEKMNVVGCSLSSIWVKTDKNNVDEVVEKLNQLGRTSVTCPEPKREVEKKEKKPTNNTAEVKAAAKKARKAANKENAAMRPYYAALRKGGVSKRIKKHNKTLAEKIEKWLKEQRAKEANKAEADKQHRAKHRQLTSKERKAAKRAHKAAKVLATKNRIRSREMCAYKKNLAEKQDKLKDATKSASKAVEQKIQFKKEGLKKAA